MTTKKLTKLLALYLPYILLGLVATNFGEAWRLAEGKELGDRIMSMMGTRTADDEQPPRRPKKRPQQKCTHRGRFWQRQDPLLDQAQPAANAQLLCFDRPEGL